MEEIYEAQLCPRCQTYHPELYKICTECGAPLRPAKEIELKSGLAANIAGFIVTCGILIVAVIAIRIFAHP